MYKIAQLLLFLSLFQYKRAANYRVFPEDEHLFINCSSNILGFNALCQEPELKTEMDESGEVWVSGTCILIWDIQPTDRVQVEMQSFRFESGTWQPFVFEFKIFDFCKIMYDKNQIWHKYWTQYIQNGECINVKGAMLKHKNFAFSYVVENVIGNHMEGRYKMVITFKAFDSANVKRPDEICIQIRGEAIKISKGILL